ncbi:MAG: PilZ domain-containing protein [Thermodesulfovibrionia bacterium]
MKKRNPRRYERKELDLEARITSGTNNYIGFIKNVSECGANIKTTVTDTVEDFIPGKRLQLEFIIPSGETIIIFPCEIVWLYTKRIRPYGLLNSFGLEISYPPLEYTEFIKAIH